MERQNSLPLGYDIIDRIMIFLPDFSALRATLLSSKSFNDVFKRHPNSITRAVAYNVAGPALPQAIRVLRYTPPPHDGLNSNSPTTSNWKETDSISPVTPSEIQELIKVANVAKALEGLFSFRHKDRTSQISKLNPMESWKFRRAMYRLMLFSKAFPWTDLERDLDDGDLVNEVLRVNARRKRFLSEFPNSELREMYFAALFLTEVMQYVLVCDPYNDGLGDLDPQDVGLSLGPAAILEAYETRSLDSIVENSDIDESIESELLRGYVFDPLKKLSEDRKLKPAVDDTSAWKSILDARTEEADACAKCSKTTGLNVWNETNWELLHYLPSMMSRGLWMLLPGRLPGNVQDCSLLRNKVSSPTFSYKNLLSEIHQIRVSPYESWNKQDWLCGECITELVKWHLWRWLLESKKIAGVQIQEDCWYGYNCRTQTHKPEHAQKLNHLCEPSRGDP